MPDKRKTSVPGLEKGLAILELLALEPRGLSLSDIAKALGNTVAGTQKPLKALLDLGYAYRNEQGGYFLSHRLFQLAHTYSPYAHFTELARPAMQRFAIETTESIHLSVKSQNRLLLIEQIQGRSIGRFTHQTGAEEDLSTTVSGRILLSNLSDAEVDMICERENIKPKQRKELTQLLSQIAKEEFHYSPSSVFHGVYDLGVPIKDRNSVTLAVITSSYIKNKVNPQNRETLLSELQKAKSEIESKL